MARKFTSGISQKKEHLELIGLISVNFALLELALATGIWMALGVDQRRGQIITSELSFKKLLALFSSLYQERSLTEEASQKLDLIIKTAIQAEEKRNVIVHSLWAEGSSESTITRTKTTAKASKGLRLQLEQVSIEDLRQIANQIAEAGYEIQFFWLSLFRPTEPPNPADGL